MWLLTSRGRPEMCAQVLAAAVENGLSTPGVLWVDGRDRAAGYENIRLPAGWTMHIEAEHRNIGYALREMYRHRPDLGWYGWTADDSVPMSHGFDADLVRAAGRDGVAYPNDLWQQGVKERDGTPHVTSTMVLGGDFVRALGDLALPGQIQMYIDDFYESVAVPAGKMRYCPEIVCEHRHFCNGKRQRDPTDTRSFNGSGIVGHDLAIYEAWMASDGPAKAVERLKC